MPPKVEIVRSRLLIPSAKTDAAWAKRSPAASIDRVSCFIIFLSVRSFKALY